MLPPLHTRATARAAALTLCWCRQHEYEKAGTSKYPNQSATPVPFTSSQTATESIQGRSVLSNRPVRIDP